MRLVVPIAVVSALAGALFAAAAPSALAGAATHTQRVVVRPVDSHGDPVAGWTVTRERGSTVSCGGHAAAAVNRNIVECFPAAEYLPSCWKSQNHTVLCLRDATQQKLVRIRYTGSIAPARAPRHPSPQNFRFVGGQKCEIRVGGAWGQLPTHPRWDGFYSCRTGNVYGPAKGDGIDRSAPLWTAHLWRNGTQHTVVTKAIATAYFVGTQH